MGMMKEFKEFAMKGNVLDLAVAVVIGAAFKTIIDSAVKDLMMPVVGMLGKADFNDFFIPLKAVPEGVKIETLKQAADSSIPVFAYGSFLTAVVNFAIVALCIFLVVKAINTLNRKKEAAPAAPPAPNKEEVLLTEIRDLLKARQ